jgi:glycerophosphoryl diester phosphodiesterase
MGKELLATLYAGKTTTAIDQLRGRSPAYKLLRRTSGGPDWAHGIPDNSVEAFKQSIGNGISSVEVDLQMDSKRNLLAFHDTSFADMVRSDDATLKVLYQKRFRIMNG